MRTVVGAVVVWWVSACGAGEQSTDIGLGDAASSISARRPPPPTPPPPPSPGGPRPGVASDQPGPAAAADVRLVRGLVALARRPSADTAARLPLAPQVRLGLGQDLGPSLDRRAAPRASAWVLEPQQSSAYQGVSSALRSIRRHAHDTQSQSVQRHGGAFEVAVGDHPRCAAPAAAAPEGLEGHRRVWVQPSRASIDSCLSWFSVDLFLDRERRIAAVTLDIWEP